MLQLVHKFLVWNLICVQGKLRFVAGLINLAINSRQLFLLYANVAKTFFISQSDKLVSECPLMSIVKVWSEVCGMTVTTLKSVKFNFPDNSVVGKRVLWRNRTFIVVPWTEDCVKSAEQNFNQIWSVEVMKVFFPKVLLVSCLDTSDYEIAVVFL